MRKNFTLTGIAVFYILTGLQAQVINKGDRLFGGSFSFSVFKINETGQGYYNAGNAGLVPSLGWAIKNNLVLGLQGAISYNRSNSNYGLSDKRTITSFSFGPGIYLKKYRELKNRFGLYFNHEVSSSYSIAKDRVGTLPVAKNKSWVAGYTFSPGVFYKFSEHFFGEANIGGLHGSYSSNGSSNNYGIGASFLQYFNLGINYRIPGKKS